MTEPIPTNSVPEVLPALPPRPAQSSNLQPQSFPEPPRRKSMQFGEDATSPVHYMRDPHKLVAYLVPFPKPEIHKGLLHKADAANIPDRFLIYTPPAPPLVAPKEGEKEDKMRKLQRKWQQEVREAKTSDAKVTSWKGYFGLFSEVYEHITYYSIELKAERLKVLTLPWVGQLPRAWIF
jgi:hypothetical protein